jgi:hypothetical protein
MHPFAAAVARLARQSPTRYAAGKPSEASLASILPVNDPQFVALWRGASKNHGGILPEHETGAVGALGDYLEDLGHPLSSLFQRHAMAAMTGKTPAAHVGNRFAHELLVPLDRGPHVPFSGHPSLYFQPGSHLGDYDRHGNGVLASLTHTDRDHGYRIRAILTPDEAHRIADHLPNETHGAKLHAIADHVTKTWHYPAPPDDEPEQYGRFARALTRFARRGRAAKYAAGDYHTTVQTLLGQLASPEHAATRRGRGDNTFRNVTADALEDNGQPDEAALLREDGAHVVVRRNRDGTHDVRRLAWQDALRDPLSRGYLDAALWSSADGEGMPLDQNHGVDAIHPHSLGHMVADVHDFRDSLPDHLKDAVDANPSRAGHDFWLSRNGHGSGFFDRPDHYGEDAADELHEHARRAGERNLDAEDGVIHQY